MGNTTSEVASGVKAQINSDGQGPELYRFVDLKVKKILIFFEKFENISLGRWRIY
jgi:hypothetical protein